MDNTWFASRVTPGNKLGTAIGFPTVNLDNPDMLSGYKHGVYEARVKVGNNTYKGALYLGPRKILNEKKVVLEINIFGYNGNLYGKEILFKVGKFIRGPMDFDDSTKLKEQLEDDISKIKSL